MSNFKDRFLSNNGAIKLYWKIDLVGKYSWGTLLSLRLVPSNDRGCTTAHASMGVGRLLSPEIVFKNYILIIFSIKSNKLSWVWCTFQTCLNVFAWKFPTKKKKKSLYWIDLLNDIFFLFSHRDRVEIWWRTTASSRYLKTGTLRLTPSQRNTVWSTQY